MLLGGTLSAMVVVLLLMSDSLIAGAAIGPDAVAGITLVSPIYSLAAFFGTVVSLGIPILYTTEMGKFNKKRADQIFGLGVLMCILMGIALFILTSLFGDMYLRSCTPTDAILSHAWEYLYWMRFSILVLPMQQLMSSAVYSDGDERISAIANAVQGAGNIALSIVLSRFMGTRGIGLASFLFYVVSLTILLIHFTKESNSLRWNLYFSFDLLKVVIRYSVIDSSSCLFSAVFTATMNAFVSSRFGPQYLILVSAVALSRYLQSLFDGIGQAVGPILSVYAGEQNHTGLRSIYKLANKTAIGEGITITLVMMAVAPLVPRVLNVTDPEMARWIVTGIRLYALGSTFVSLLYLISSYYLVIRQIALGLAVCALRDVILNAGLAMVLGRVFGLTGLFIGLAAAPAVAWALLLIYISARCGRDDCPLLLSRVPGSDQSWLFQLSVEQKQIIDLQKKVEALLREHGVDSRTVGKVKLLIEDIYVLIMEKNENRPVLGELTVFLKPEGVEIITKDDGVLFDISQEDVYVTSIAAFAVSAYMEKLEDRRHLTTMSFNRSAFLIKPLAQ